MILIADDFGLGRGHDRVILKLLKTGRLNGTSIMVNENIAPEDIKTLVSLRKNKPIQIGLHLNFTQDLAEIKAIAPISKLLRDCILNNISKDVFERNINYQVLQFKQIFDMEPDFIDGHQHCHILPRVASVLAKIPHETHTWVRIPVPTTIDGLWLNLKSSGIKTLVVIILSLLAKSNFKRANWKMNDDFSGFLSLQNPKKVLRYFPKILSSAKKSCVVMVHPGDKNDPIQCTGHMADVRTIEAEKLHEV